MLVEVLMIFRKCWQVPSFMKIFQKKILSLTLMPLDRQTNSKFVLNQSRIFPADPSDVLRQCCSRHHAGHLLHPVAGSPERGIRPGGGGEGAEEGRRRGGAGEERGRGGAEEERGGGEVGGGEEEGDPVPGRTGQALHREEEAGARV